MITKEYLESKGFEEGHIKMNLWDITYTSCMTKFSFCLFDWKERGWCFNWQGGNTLIKTEEHLERLYEALLGEKL